MTASSNAGRISILTGPPVGNSGSLGRAFNHFRRARIGKRSNDGLLRFGGPGPELMARDRLHGDKDNTPVFQDLQIQERRPA